MIGSIELILISFDHGIYPYNARIGSLPCRGVSRIKKKEKRQDHSAEADSGVNGVLFLSLDIFGHPTEITSMPHKGSSRVTMIGLCWYGRANVDDRGLMHSCREP